MDYSLQNKIVDGKLYVDQGIIAGCAGGGFENICAAADIIRGKYIGADEFTFSVYPAKYAYLHGTCEERRGWQTLWRREPL